MAELRHLPVLLEEAIDALQIVHDGRYLDGTAGWGGHAAAIAQRLSTEGFLLALDQDERAVLAVREHLAAFGPRVRVMRSRFGQMEAQAQYCGYGAGSFSGVLMDLGIGSHQLDDAERGFSFLHDGPLDMRFDRSSDVSAADLVNAGTETELAELLRSQGGEHRGRRIARAIVRRREETPFTRTTDLAEVVSRAAGGRRGKKTHPATKTFQALRMAVNDELGELRAALPQAVSLLAPGGRLVIISFHSVEDATVKYFMREAERPCVCPPDLGTCVCERKPTLKLERRKVIKPSAEEVERNPRARSARLRVAVRTRNPHPPDRAG